MHQHLFFPSICSFFFIHTHTKKAIEKLSLVDIVYGKDRGLNAGFLLRRGSNFNYKDNLENKAIMRHF